MMNYFVVENKWRFKINFKVKYGETKVVRWEEYPFYQTASKNKSNNGYYYHEGKTFLAITNSMHDA